MNQDSFQNKPTLFAASGLYLLAAMGLWLVSLFAGELGRLFPQLTQEEAGLAVSVAYYVPFMILPVFFYAAKRGGGQAMLRNNPISFGSMLCAGASALPALMLVQSMTALWMILCQKLGLDVMQETYVRPENVIELMLSTIAAAVVVPIGEEFLFRGAMFSAWERRGRGRAILATAVLFAMLHGSLLGLPGELFGGILMAQLVLWTDSIYAGLAFHSVYNAGGVVLNYLSSAVSDPSADAQMATDLLAYLGGGTAVVAMVLDVLIGMLLIRLLTGRMRMRYTFRRMLTMAEREGKPVSPRDLMKMNEAPPEPLSVAAALVLMAGVVSVLGLYVFDMISMLGG